MVRQYSWRIVPRIEIHVLMCTIRFLCAGRLALEPDLRFLNHFW